MKKTKKKTKAIVVWLMIIIFHFGAIAMLFLIFLNKGKAPEIRLKVTILTKSLETHVFHVILYLKY